MTAVEVCPICDIAGCRHIRERKAKMTHPTRSETTFNDEELIARLRVGVPTVWEKQAADRIEALVKDRDQAWEVAHAATDRGMRAEAALAAQIEADAWQPIETAPKDGTDFIAWWPFNYSGKVVPCYWVEEKGNRKGYFKYMSIKIEPTHWKSFPSNPDQPHDRSALDRMQADAREKELTEVLHHIDFCGESEPLAKARAALARVKGGDA